MNTRLNHLLLGGEPDYLHAILNWQARDRRGMPGVEVQ
jgi:hypothetical protein